MAHYGTLRDYRFSADVDDIRGATLYGSDHEKLGKIDDVVFDHSTGEIRYLVVDLGHDRKHLVPSDRVYRAVTDEQDFEANLRKSDLESLPIFDETSMGSEQSWKEYEKRYHEASRKREQELETRYKEGGWHAAPVQHRVGSSHDITPEPEEMPAAPSGESAPERRVISGADLTPERLAGKFPDTAPGSSKVTMNIAGTPARADNAAHTEDVLSPRWQRFSDNLRRNLEKIRAGCGQCGGRKAA